MREETSKILLEQMALLQEKSNMCESIDDLCRLSDSLALIAQIAHILTEPDGNYVPAWSPRKD